MSRSERQGQQVRHRLHPLSKRTNLYAAYAKISTNADALNNFSVRVGTSAEDSYLSGFNVGLRHQF